MHLTGRWSCEGDVPTDSVMMFGELGGDGSAGVRGGPTLFELLSTSNALVSVTPAAN